MIDRQRGSLSNKCEGNCFIKNNQSPNLADLVIFSFPLTCTLTIFVGHGIMAHTGVAAKLIKYLDLRYPMTQFLIITVIELKSVQSPCHWYCSLRLGSSFISIIKSFPREMRTILASDLAKGNVRALLKPWSNGA